MKRDRTEAHYRLVCVRGGVWLCGCVCVCVAGLLSSEGLPIIHLSPSLACGGKLGDLCIFVTPPLTITSQTHFLRRRK